MKDMMRRGWRRFAQGCGRIGAGIDAGGLALALWLRKHLDWVLVFCAATAGLVARYLLVPYVSLDLLNCVFPWMMALSPAGYNLGGQGFLYLVSEDFHYDQTPFYMLIQAILAQLPAGPMATGIAGGNPYPLYYDYYIKSVSMAFDLALASGVYAVVGVFRKDRIWQALGFALAFLLPMQAVNSGMWGQNDSYYACFSIWALYFLLTDRPYRAMALAGLSLAAKAQGVLLVPFYVFLWLRRRLKLRHALAAFGTFLMPTAVYWLLGSSFAKPFAWLGNGLGSYQELDYGSGNLWSYFSYYTNGETAAATNALMTGMAFAVAAGALGMLILALIGHHTVLDRPALVLLAALFAIAVPFVLPKMHERYFYLFDVMVLVYALVYRRRWWLVVLKQLSSAMAYSSFMFSRSFFGFMSGTDNVILIALVNTAILVVMLYDAFRLPTAGPAEREAERLALESRRRQLAAVFRGRPDAGTDGKDESK